MSRLCLGCLAFGVPAKGRPWTIEESESRSIIRRALDFGINFFDTANIYLEGTSEEVLGRSLHKLVRRDEVVIATKVRGRTRPGPNGEGLSRKAILHEVDASLKRLGTDYIDLYQIHRWDPDTPIEETLEALHDIVKSGKVRYIGASSTLAWQLCKALYIAENRGWSRFISMQSHVNLLYREEEREMLGLCQAEGVAMVPWSPLARGKLARPWGHKGSTRARTDADLAELYDDTDQAEKAIVDVVGEIAAEREITRAQVALAWLLQKPGVTAPVVGVSRMQHLVEAMGSLEVRLDDDEVRRLESNYRPRAVAGFW